jgi:elongation factor P--beta-lysine ligase
MSKNRKPEDRSTDPRWIEQKLSLDRALVRAESELYCARGAAVGYDRLHWLMKAIAALDDSQKRLLALVRKVRRELR